MEWDHESTLSFIDKYKKHCILWDPKDPHYYNKLKKQDAWETLAQEVGMPWEGCKKKMNNLLAALRREKMKINKNKGTGKDADDIYTSSWFAYESMQFLLDKNKARTTLDTLTNASSSQIKMETSPEDPVNEEDQTSRSKNENNGPEPSRYKRKKIIDNQEQERLDTTFEILQNSGDDSQHFGNLVASKLRKFEEDTRCAIQADIMQIFVRANRGYYNYQHETSSILPVNSPLPSPNSQISNSSHTSSYRDPLLEELHPHVSY